MRTFRFYKDEIGWFVDLPEWTGEKWELQMVAGADLFLEMINSGDDEYQVYLTLSDEPFENSDVLELDCLGRIEGSLASALLLSIPPRQFWSGKPRAEFA